MIIECSECGAKVDGKVIGQYDWMPDWSDPIKIVLLSCPICKTGLVGLSQGEFIFEENECTWTNLRRIWPDPSKNIDFTIPLIVRNSLDEAKKCIKAKAFSACAVMCGRAVEGICMEYKTKSKTLHNGLKELLDKGVIDKRLYNWSNELRKERNLGAHASGKETKKDDARDLLDFANAICEYVFVLTNKYEQYCERKKKTKPKKK